MTLAGFGHVEIPTPCCTCNALTNLVLIVEIIKHAADANSNRIETTAHVGQGRHGT